MAKSLFQDIRDYIKTGNMVTRLILLNLGITVIVLLASTFFKQDFYRYTLLSSDIIWDLKHPWIFFTHLFISKSIMTLIWNMLILYWFGAIIGDLIGDNKILPLYLLGGLAGSILFLVFSNLILHSDFTMIEGSSSAILAIMVSSAVLVPDYKFRLLILGEVSLKFVVAVYIGIEFLYAISSHNLVYLAFIGSTIFGWYYIYSIRKGLGLDKPFNSILASLKQYFFSKKNKQKRNLSVKYKSKKSFVSGVESTKSKAEHTKELDRILDKIKEKGYENLTEIEKEFLFLASKD
jgi:membrane associated rhomboid family serine protease